MLYRRVLQTGSPVSSIPFGACAHTLLSDSILSGSPAADVPAVIVVSQRLPAAWERSVITA
jgi:hypothetical protein